MVESEEGVSQSWANHGQDAVGRPTFHPPRPLALLHTEPRAAHTRPVRRVTHQQTSPATTADQVTQQDWRGLACRQQHAHTR